MIHTLWQSRAAAWGSALLMAAAFPPFDLWPLVLVAPLPLFLAVWSGGRTGVEPESDGPKARVPVGSGFWRGFRLGWQFGFVFFTATLWWVQHVTLPGMLALCAYLALYPALVLGIAGWLGLRRDSPCATVLAKALIIAGAWSGLEWVRSVALSGFPWNELAVPLFPVTVLRLLSASIGVRGLAAGVLLFPLLAAAFLHLSGRSRLRVRFLLFGFTLLAAGLVLFGEMFIRVYRVSPAGERPLTALLVQPDVSMKDKMSPEAELQRQRYFDLTTLTDDALDAADGSAGHPKPGLVVWPESAVPEFLDRMIASGAFRDLLERGDFTLITGADHREWDQLYNSVVAMRGTVDNLAVHPKVRLVPFGEFIPFRKQIPVFEKLLGGLIPVDFDAGTSLEPLRLEGQAFSMVPLVCFEDTISDHARRFIRPEPQVMVNVTNDNWFHQSPATRMHFVNARWRAVELRRTLLRSANTGVTAIVSPSGEVQEIPSFEKGVLTGSFSTGGSRITFFAAHGDVFAQTAGLTAMACCAGVGLRRRRRRAAQPVLARMPETAEKIEETMQ